MDLDIFERQLATILQNAGPGTVAEHTDTVIGYWNGNRLAYAEVDTEGTGAITGAFEMDVKTLDALEGLAKRLADRSRTEHAA